MKIVCEPLLNVFRQIGVCSWCGNAGRTEVAHIVARGMGGGSRLDIPVNLVSLGAAFSCRCHAKSHEGERPLTVDLLAVIAARYEVSQKDIDHEIKLAQGLGKGKLYTCPFTGFWFCPADPDHPYRQIDDTLSARILGTAPRSCRTTHLATEENFRGWHDFGCDL